MSVWPKSPLFQKKSKLTLEVGAVLEFCNGKDRAKYVVTNIEGKVIKLEFLDSLKTIEV